jgi:AcrR family transcriptional regulator
MAGFSELVPPSRPKRADARRNYDRLVAAAEAAFERDGPEASLDAIAKAAGVGPGTLYRHFPGRRALLEAVYTERIVELCQLAPQLAAEHEPVEALSRWLRRVVQNTMAYRGLKEVLTADSRDVGEPLDFSWCAEQMHATCQSLLERAQATGQIDAPVQEGDLLRLVHGVVLAVGYLPEPERTASSDRMLNVMFKGLGAGSSITPG